jgi:hypothetical protein
MNLTTTVPKELRIDSLTHLNLILMVVQRDHRPFILIPTTPDLANNSPLEVMVAAMIAVILLLQATWTQQLSVEGNLIM